MIRAIIVEDEIESRQLMRNLIKDYCPDVAVLGVAGSVLEAKQLIIEHNPQLVFLDIEMPGGNGFTLFDHFAQLNFEVIFTTAYNNYALKALKLSAIDYLLKPIVVEDLQGAINKAVSKIESNGRVSRWIALKDNQLNAAKKIALPTSTGYDIVDVKEIVRCEADGNYTTFYLASGERVLVTQTLKVYQDILEDFDFMRISRSHLVNLNFLKKYGRQKAPTITLIDDTVLSVSVNKKDDLLRFIEGE